jgi:hypothetical protein
MSKTIVLADSVLQSLINTKSTEIPQLQNAPTIIKTQGCGCKGKPKTKVQIVDFNALRKSLLDDQDAVAAIKAALKVDKLVFFIQLEDNKISREFR